MSVLASALVLVVAAVHVYILVLEMFLWTKPLGRRVFGNDEEFARQTAVLGANQGLYNGFLAAGLIWGAFASDPVGFQVSVFFLGCVIVAGLYGAVSFSPRTLWVQSVPAAIALVAVLLS